MQIKDQVEFVSQHVKKNKMRIFTTILATTMGCAFLIVLASIAFGLEGSIKEEILSDDALTKIELYGTTEDGKVDVEKIKSFDDVSAVVNLVHIQADLFNTAKLENRTADGTTIQLTNFTENKNAKIPLSSGKYPTEENGIVVGYNFAETLLNEQEKQKMREMEEQDGEKEQVKSGYSGNLLGKKMSFSWSLPSEPEKKVTKEFIVSGIAEKPVKEWDSNTNVLMSDKLEPTLTSEFMKTFGNQVNENELFDASYLVFAKDLEAVKAVNKKLKDMHYSTYTVSEQLEEISLVFGILKAGLIFIGTIAILIASIGIFNTMTMAVTERTREIGVMKAIGASPKLIQRLFVMESAYIGIIGTAIAIVISYAISIISNFAIPKILVAITNEVAYGEQSIVFSAIPWELVATASIISIGVAIVSGWRPARKATKIDVIQALKQD